jgi:hypothetical protein
MGSRVLHRLIYSLGWLQASPLSPTHTHTHTHAHTHTHTRAHTHTHARALVTPGWRCAW